MHLSHLHFMLTVPLFLVADAVESTGRKPVPPYTKQIGAGQYVNQIMNKNPNLLGYHEVSSLIKSLREGWKTEIEIIIAFDTIIRSGVVVDGTKHLLALLVIKE
jgi:hypothetical protein